MKIMIVCPYYLPCIGGLENYTANIAQCLQGDGHDIVVVTSGARGSGVVEETHNGVRVIRLPTLLRVSNTPVNPSWALQLRRIVRRERPDVVNAHTPVPFMADMAARAAGSTPFVVTYHNDLSKSSRFLQMVIGLYWQGLGRGTLRRADRVIATSRFYADNSARLSHYAAKTVIVPPAVDTRRFHAAVDKTWLSKEYPGEPKVLFVGSLARTHAHKGLDLLLQAITLLKRDMPEVRLIVVGQGDNTSSYARLSRELGIADNVTWTGFVEDQDLPRYYAGADVFVLPSTNQAEGFGMVLAEASACGTPVIGTNVGGIPAAMRMIGSPNLVQPNSQEIAAMLRKVLAQGEQGACGEVLTWQSAAARTAHCFQAAMMPRVTLIHNVVSPYRLAMFQDLAKHTNLQVLFSQRITRDRKWRYDLSQYSFDYKVLASLPLGPVSLNPGALMTLVLRRFDVLITNTDPDTPTLSLTGLLLSKLLGRPLLVWSEVTDEAIQSGDIFADAGRRCRRAFSHGLSRGVISYRRLFFRSAALSLAFSEHAEAFLRRNGVMEGKVRRTFEVMPRELMPAPSVVGGRSGKAFLYLGYLSNRKNVHLLIEAFMRVDDPRARLTIAGTGDQEAALRRSAGGDGRISFVGLVDGQAKADLYGRSDVLVLPSRHDCWGLVVNEAIHYGLAVIVSDAAAASELVTPDTGIVVAAGDRSALTEAMSAYVGDTEGLHRVQTHNLGNLDVCDVPRAVAPFVAAIREVLA